MSKKNQTPTETSETTAPSQLLLSAPKQSIIVGLFTQKQQLERQINVLNEAFNETIAPILPPGTTADQYQLATDDQTGVLFLELKPEPTDKPVSSPQESDLTKQNQINDLKYKEYYDSLREKQPASEREPSYYERMKAYEEMNKDNEYGQPGVCLG